jgi:hypothetical protein
MQFALSWLFGLRSKDPEQARIAVWVVPGDLLTATLSSVAFKDSLTAIIARRDHQRARTAGTEGGLHGVHDRPETSTGENVAVLAISTGPNVSFCAFTTDGEAKDSVSRKRVVFAPTSGDCLHALLHARKIPQLAPPVENYFSRPRK